MSLLHDEYMRAVGRVTINAANFDAKILFCIWSLLGAPQQLAIAVTRRLSSRQGIDTLDELVDLRVSDPESKGQLKELLKHAGRLADERNRVVHDATSSDEEGQTFKVRFARGNSTTATTRIEVSKLESLADELRDVSNQILISLEGWHPGAPPGLDKNKH